MLDKIKALIAGIEPKLIAIISLAPFLMGLILGYLLRTPIGWLISLARLALKL